MGRYLRVTASLLLLLLQGLHTALLQDPTISPGRTIDKSWLRNASPGPTIDQSWFRKPQLKNEDADQNGVESTDDGDANISDSVLITSGEEDYIHNLDAQRTDVTFVTVGLPEMSSDPAESAESTLTAAAHTTMLLNTTQITHAASEPLNSTTALYDITTHPFTQGSVSNDTDSIETTTTMATEINITEEATPEIQIDSSVANGTTLDDINTSTTEEPESIVSTANLTTKLPSGTPAVDAIPENYTTAPRTTEVINSTDTVPASGSSSERGFAADVRESKRSAAWGAVLGTAVAVAFVGVVVSVILKKRGQRDFTHRKLVEFPSDPVLRLDNSEPLDLKYDGSAYYNPGLQMDNIQMDNFPHRSGN